MVDALDPSRKQKLAAQKRARQLLATLGISGDVKLSEYEMLIASQLVDPASIRVSFADIAGLEALVAELRQAVILPIQKRSLFAHSSLMVAPKGVLLHGPPGCGKTMVAKATARYAYEYISSCSVFAVH
jgi:ATP-dependent 26S proteasome regulatory subunit